MQVENDRFFVVQTASESYVLPEEDAAIDHLRENSEDIDAEGDDVSVAEVQFGDGDWTIKELPWQKIALQLL